MNVPGNGRDLEEHGTKLTEEPASKWNTIRFAIGEWGTTVRLLSVLIVLLGPAYLAYLIFLIVHH